MTDMSRFQKTMTPTEEANMETAIRTFANAYIAAKSGNANEAIKELSKIPYPTVKISIGWKAAAVAEKNSHPDTAKAIKKYVGNTEDETKSLVMWEALESGDAEEIINMLFEIGDPEVRARTAASATTITAMNGHFRTAATIKRLTVGMDIHSISAFLRK